MGCWLLTFCGKAEKLVFLLRRGNWTLGPKVLEERELSLVTSNKQPARHPHKNAQPRNGQIRAAVEAYTNILETFFKENNMKL